MKKGEWSIELVAKWILGIALLILLIVFIYALKDKIVEVATFVFDKF